jgi:predicted nucleic acid-binding protein
MLIDTDVLIWYLRGDAKARRAIEAARAFSLSVISYMELVQGMRNRAELNALRRSIRAWEARIVYIDPVISAKAMLYVEEHFLSHSLQMADALIAATAMECGLPLLTGDSRHYGMIKGLDVRVFRPSGARAASSP